MKPLSVARLRQMASRLHLEFDESELTSLRPMVQDLLEVAQMLRHKQSGGIDGVAQRQRDAQKSG
jgi:hypothetical protein